MSVADVQPILDAVVSHAAASGWFERVNQHEPKSKTTAGPGMTAAIWVQWVGAEPGGSGLASTSGRIELTVRIYTSMLAEPQDAIDPNVLGAAIDLMRAYSGDFTLGGLVRDVDLLGMSRAGLNAQAGYLLQDGKLFRVMDILLPIVINDLWMQVGQS